MPKLDKCQGCGVSFKHHELCLHRKVTGCGTQFPLRKTAVKDRLHFEKRSRIEAKKELVDA